VFVLGCRDLYPRRVPTFLLSLTNRNLGDVAFCDGGNVAAGKLSRALADDLGERCRRADNVGVGHDVDQGNGVGG
jgi:hypothetical protein